MNKDKLHQILSSLWKNDDSVGNTYYNQALQDVQTAIDLQKEYVSKVWHYQKKEPVDEIADKSRPIIVVYGNNSLNAAGKFRYYENNSDAIWLSNSYEKWAFVEDLINLTHSVTKVSWQEEPVSIWYDASKKSDNPEDVVIINPSDNTGEVLTKCTGVNQGHIWTYTSVLLKLDNPCKIGKNLQEEPVNVWHDTNKETPTQGSNILMVRKEEEDTNYPPIAGCFHGTNSRFDGRNWGYYDGFCYNEIEPPVKWAYIDELIEL